MSPAVLKTLSRQRRRNSSSGVVTSSFETALKTLVDFLINVDKEKFTHWCAHYGQGGQTVYHFFCEEVIGTTAFDKAFTAKEVAVWVELKRIKRKVKYTPHPERHKGKPRYNKGWRISSIKGDRGRKPQIIFTATWCKNKENA